MEQTTAAILTKSTAVYYYIKGKKIHQSLKIVLKNMYSNQGHLSFLVSYMKQELLDRKLI